MRGTGLIVIVAAALSLAGFSSSLAASDSGSRGATVSTAKTNLGKIIVNGRGHTLYLFEKDKHGKSACSGACAKYWPPLITHGKPVAAGGAKQALLGTIKRSNGSRQVTYAGQTKGEGSTLFGAGWDALTPAGKKIEGDG